VSRVMIGLLCMLLGANLVEAATVGLFSNQRCTSCNLNIRPGATQGTFFVCAVGTSSAEFCGGFYSLEFRIGGIPLGWTATAVPSAASRLALGDPFGESCTIAFDPPQAEECALLYTVTIEPSSPGARATVRARAPLFPANPDFDCIRAVSACRGNVGICVDGSALLINSDATCSVAVEPTSWAQVKALYE